MNLLYQYSTINLFLTSGNPQAIEPGNLIFFGLLIIVFGLVSIIFPQFFWQLRVGRKIPGVPPNKLYLMVLRFGGLLVIILGLIMLYYAWSISHI